MEDEVKTKNFRDEDMVTRRAFLRSYPLRWEEEDGDGEEEQQGASPDEEKELSRTNKRYSKVKSVMKSNLINVMQWGEGKLLLLRKVKNKVAFYLVACHPFGFKAKFITVD